MLEKASINRLSTKGKEEAFDGKENAAIKVRNLIHIYRP